MTSDDDRLTRRIRQIDRQRAHWHLHGERSVGRNLAMIGVLGWMVVAPTLLGIVAGRWLDRTFDTGIFWTGACLVAGLAFGCWLGWRWIHEQ